MSSRAVVVGVGTSVACNVLVVIALAWGSRPPTDVSLPATVRVMPQPPPAPTAPSSGGGTGSVLALMSVSRPALAPLPVPAVSGALAMPVAGVGIGLEFRPLTLPEAGSAPVVSAEPPRLLAAIDLARFYPRRARREGIAGSSVLALSLDATGTITTWRVVSSDPPGVFEESLGRLVPTLRYAPATRDGFAIPAETTCRIAWRLE